MTVIPTSAFRAQCILFVSFGVTLFVAFIAVLGKQWILYYTQATTWGNIADRGRERQAKLAGLQKWGLRLIMESLPVMLQFALLLFGVALIVYLWDLEPSSAAVTLVVTCIGFGFYACFVIAATFWRDCPFQTPLSVVLPEVWPWTKELIAHSRFWWSRRLKPRATTLLRVKRVEKLKWVMRFIGRTSKKLTGPAETQNQATGDQVTNEQYMVLSNPAFWRHDPLFTSPISKDMAPSAGIWLLENSTDFSAATAVAAVFSEFQWPSHQRSTTALIRFRDTYVECFRLPEFKKATRDKALQSAAAYYILYHTQLIWCTSKNLEADMRKFPKDLPPDLFLYKHDDKWNGDDVFEYLLHIDERLEPVTSTRFLSYIAPYWFCGDSDSAIKFRPSRLETLRELIEVLEKSQSLNPATLTDCVLCAGAAMDFPLHPEDLIQYDKRCARSKMR